MAPEAAARRCGFCATIAKIAAGERDDLVAELPSSFVILGDAQFYRGYCILFTKLHVTELFEMPADEASALLAEMVGCAAAIAAVVRPFKMNYECLGNLEPHVHWHLLPRFESDPMRQAPVWMRPEGERKVALPESERDALIAAIRAEIVRRFPQAQVR